MTLEDPHTPLEYGVAQDCCALAPATHYMSGGPCAPVPPSHCTNSDTDPLFTHKDYGTCLKDKDNVELLSYLTSPLGETIVVYSLCALGLCNCVYRIGNVVSQLKPCRFASILLDPRFECSDSFMDVLWGVTDGFPIVDEDVPQYECENYSSITSAENKGKMDEILRRELDEGCVSPAISKPTCIHALGAVPKGVGKIRHITDCSRPLHVSVNNHCSTLLEEFSFKNISTAVGMLEGGEFLSVIDIKSAYRAVPIKEDHRKYQGFSWELDGATKYYVDNRMCFGLRLGPSYFNRLSCFIYEILSVFYGLRVVNYLDDFLSVSDSLEEALNARDLIVKTLRFLGFHVAFDKLIYPSKCVTFLGIILDTDRMELRLPEGKLHKLLDLLNGHLSKKKVSKKDLESIGGLLSHCAHLVKGGRIFCKSTYELYKQMVLKNKRYIKLSAEVIADFNWWIRLFPFFNGTVKMFSPEFELPMVSDSSLKGFAVYLGQDWVAGTWDDGDHIPLFTNCQHVGYKPVWDSFDRKNINELELWPIVVGLKRWVKFFRDKLLHVFTDNTQVMFMLINGNSSNPTCSNWLREIFWLCAIYNVTLCPKYISTKSNLVADTLSRLPYFKDVSKLSELLSGSELCCLFELFVAYRETE